MKKAASATNVKKEAQNKHALMERWEKEMGVGHTCTAWPK